MRRTKKGPKIQTVLACMAPVLVTLVLITWMQSLLPDAAAEDDLFADEAQVLREIELQQPARPQYERSVQRPPHVEEDAYRPRKRQEVARPNLEPAPQAAPDQKEDTPPKPAPAPAPTRAPVPAEAPTPAPTPTSKKKEKNSKRPKALVKGEVATVDHIENRLQHKWRHHDFVANSPDVKNQPSFCKQRPGRDYKTDPIFYITPVGTGGLEEMPCPVRCTFSSDHSRWREADGIMYAIPGGAGPPPERTCPLQKYILFSMESEAYYPVLAFKEGYKTWDVLGTTRLDSDVPLIYGSWAEYGFNEPRQRKTADAMAVAAISNCGAMNNRLDVLQELMRYGVTVHSYGSCLHNKDSVKGGGGWFKEKIDMLRPYKFVLAFENSNVDDYVTEKFYQALVAGTVPVYMGAPNIRDFYPAEKSVINVNDFASYSDLADYLKFLDKNDDEYEKYLAWKKDGLAPSFLRILNESSLHSNCRLCIRMKQIFQAELDGIPDVE